MYLAPLNYDRYFKKVFSDLKIAKHFLEDFLDVEIQEITFLEKKKTITDDAKFVEFDFRCKIENHFVIIEMQQWYKPDIVQRFYLYHALNTALQLEELPEKQLLLPIKGLKEVKDYRGLLPVITLVWMVDDNMGFKQDFIGFALTPENLTTFIKDVKLWNNPEIKELIEQRNLLLEQLNNNKKGLKWLQQNRIIYAFQNNIVRNKKYKRYYRWFELAQKTLEKISDKFAYSDYEKDDIFKEIIRRLKREIESPEEIRYIENYDEFIDGILRYENGVREDALRDGIEQGIEQGIEKGIEKGIEQGIEKGIEQGRKMERVKTVSLLHSIGLSAEEIAEKLELPIEDIYQIIK